MSLMSAEQNCKVSHGIKAKAPICKGGLKPNQFGIMVCGDGYKCEDGYELHGQCCLPIGEPHTKKPLSTNAKIGIVVGGVALIGLLIFLKTRK